MELARNPAIKYRLNPKIAQIAIAIGADNWNSLPGIPVGILNEPLTRINEAIKLVSTSRYVFLFNETVSRSEEHKSELQSRDHLVMLLLLVIKTIYVIIFSC